MKKLYFGRYLYKDSVIHKLNPLIKLLSIIILISLSAVAKDLFTAAAMTLMLCLALYAGKIGIKDFYPSIRSFRFLLVFTFIVQAFFSASGDFSIKPSIPSVLQSLLSTYRFALIIAFSALFTITTTPADIARSLYFFVKPFKIFKINTKDTAVSLLVAIRFIPLLFEESDKIITAQKLRGAWAANDSFFNKFKFFTKAESFIIPLFMRVVHYAEQISITLCYRDNLEDVMALPRIKAKDTVILIATLIAAVGVYFVL